MSSVKSKLKSPMSAWKSPIIVVRNGATFSVGPVAFFDDANAFVDWFTVVTSEEFVAFRSVLAAGRLPAWDASIPEVMVPLTPEAWSARLTLSL